MTTNCAYDGLNRVTRKTYSDGVTPEVDFVYDQAVAPMPPSATLSNANGRLAYAFTPGSTMDIYSYDPMGRARDMWQWVPAASTPMWDAHQSYDLGGDLLSLGYNGGATLSYQYDSTQRITNVTAPLPGLSGLTTPLFGNVTYGPVGLLSATLGTGTSALAEARAYGPRTWLSTLTVGSSPFVYSLTNLTYSGNGDVQRAT